MKESCLSKIIRILLVVVAMQVIQSCSEADQHNHGQTANAGTNEKYTCPMHPQVVQDKPGTCPICGMDLVLQTSGHSEDALDTSITHLLKPVNERVIASIPAIKPEVSTRIFSVPVQGVVTYDDRKQSSISSRVAGRIERMYIKYNYQQVKQGQVIMEIYSPELVAAQRELLYTTQTDQNTALSGAARQKLLLLGMSPSQISTLLKTGKPLYRIPVYSNVSGFIVERLNSPGATIPTAPQAPAPTTGGDGMSSMGGGSATTASALAQPSTSPTPVILREGQYISAGQTIFNIYSASGMVAEFSLHPSVLAEIKTGQKLIYNPISDSTNILSGTVALIEPRQQSGQSFSVARVYLSGKGLLPGQLLMARLPVVKTNTTWLPEDAVLNLGSKSVVFKQEGKVYIPKQISTGLRINGLVEINSPINDWLVAKKASFLVDSESFINTNEERR